MIKEGTRVWVSALYSRVGICLVDKPGAYGVVYGWSDRFNRYAVLVDGFKDCIMVLPECITILNFHDKENNK